MDQNELKYVKMLNLETVTWTRHAQYLGTSRIISDLGSSRATTGVDSSELAASRRKVDQVIWISPCQHDGNSVTIGYLCLQKEVENSRDTKTVLYCFDCSLWVLIMRYGQVLYQSICLPGSANSTQFNWGLNRLNAGSPASPLIARVFQTSTNISWSSNTSQNMFTSLSQVSSKKQRQSFQTKALTQICSANSNCGWWLSGTQYSWHP